VVTASRDDQFTEYISARMPALRRLALLLCHDWHGTGDLVQAAITKLYLHWGRARASASIDACVRTILVGEFLRERRRGWARRVTVTDQPLGRDQSKWTIDPIAPSEPGRRLAALSGMAPGRAA
jgi:DNA-directed RNA polymerase specialized sigma24 family protein